jgi:hypothetical protein
MRISTARVRTAVLTTALTAGLCAAAVTPAQAAQSAPARKLPVVYLGAGAGPWAQPTVRPHQFLLGADYSIGPMHWTRWTQTTAVGHGRYLACAGASGPCTKFTATLTLTHVKVHRGTRYFATMKITGKHRKAAWLVMSASLGWWVRK